MKTTVIALCVSLACACTVQDQEEMSVTPSGELANFATFVQPVLAASCASLDCHGQEGRPLRLYAKDGLRQAAELRGQDASDDELAANMMSIAGLEPQSTQIEDHLFLRKPLALDHGGIHHVGGELWADQTDPSYRCLHAWLRAGAGDEPGQAICDAAVP